MTPELDLRTQPSRSLTHGLLPAWRLGCLVHWAKEHCGRPRGYIPENLGTYGRGPVSIQQQCRSAGEDDRQQTIALATAPSGRCFRRYICALPPRLCHGLVTRVAHWRHPTWPLACARELDNGWPSLIKLFGFWHGSTRRRCISRQTHTK